MELLERTAEVAAAMRREIEKRIVGQRDVVDELLTALLANGHALLVGVPGLAKTLLVQTLAEALDLDFSRIQFTPDLMPTDITGTEVIEEDRTTGRRVFRFVKGPIFANVVLADEINRTPPKTQAALLEAMQERAVTAAGERYPLPPPFFVLATQNPIEQEGTYPLPEAQLDRFMLELPIYYPSKEEEEEVAMRTTGEEQTAVESVVSATGADRPAAPGAPHPGAALVGVVRGEPRPVHAAVRGRVSGMRALRLVGRGTPGVSVPRAGRQGTRGVTRSDDPLVRRRARRGAGRPRAPARAQLRGGGRQQDDEGRHRRAAPGERGLDLDIGSGLGDRPPSRRPLPVLPR